MSFGKTDKPEDHFKFFGPERRSRDSGWRSLFRKEILEEAESSFYQDGIETDADSNGNPVLSWLVPLKERKSRARVQIVGLPENFDAPWDSEDFRCSACHRPKKAREERWYDFGDDPIWGFRRHRTLSGWEPCVHVAAALINWERKHGPIEFRESPGEYEERLAREKSQREYLDRLNARKALSGKGIPAADYFHLGDEKKTKGLVFFNFEKALAPYTTDSDYAAHEPRLGSKLKLSPSVRIEADEAGNHSLSAVCSWFTDFDGPAETKLGMSADRILTLSCTCRHHRDDIAEGRKTTLCEHELALLRAAMKHAEENLSEDITDTRAREFFRGVEFAAKSLRQAEEEAEKERTRPPRRPDVSLAPRIVDDGFLYLSIKAFRAGRKPLLCKNPRNMVDAWESGDKYRLSSIETLDFSASDFTPDSVPLRDFIKNHWGNASAQKCPLEGPALDAFYDLAEGSEAEYVNRDTGFKGFVKVAHAAVTLPIALERLNDAAGRLAGMRVTGTAPRILHGEHAHYAWDGKTLSRLSPREKALIKPFSEACGIFFKFSFIVGRNRIPEFCNRILPELSEKAGIITDVRLDDGIASSLPPEPAFSFAIDREKSRIVCRAAVSYGERKHVLGTADTGDGEYHDNFQEKRVRNELAHHFRYQPKESLWAMCPVTDDRLYELLSAGIPALSTYGEVRGTEFFRDHSVSRMPEVKVGVSVEGGIMDLRLSSEDADEEELIAIFESYRLRKKYYRLRGGRFIDLSQNAAADDLESFLASIDVAPREAVGKAVRLPLYRALYLDRMLDEHEQVVSSRDRTYRALVRSFGSIKNSDYEPPESLEKIMRPYQTLGYKWLRVLEQSGFGGILADDMGLGKTLQMISLFLSEKEEGASRPSLVVCPASLVYNWVEEIRKFAPALPCTAVDGTLSRRKKLLESAAAGNATGGTVYITSYDLLKRDIALYGDIAFSCCVLDEAQYIKNPGTAASKSVKALQALHRFALTGTPIENRLSELWSIFDFLMPGFLYGRREFESRFEAPIAKSGDAEASERLHKMIAPFVLRRMKKDVLKDLPEKLEELRFARLGPTQQKLYDAQVVRMKKLIGEGDGSGESKIRVLAELTRLRQLCCDPSLVFEDYSEGSAKREACLELVQSAIDGGHRVLLYSQFVSMLELIERDLKEAGIAFFKITGATPKQERLALARQFNEGAEPPVFLISLKAGGTGLNLTGADVVIHYDPWWNVAAQNQATDRAHRIGQEKQVTVFRLVAKNTVEERILGMQEKKRELADAILKGASGSIMSLSKEELLELLG